MAMERQSRRMGSSWGVLMALAVLVAMSVVGVRADDDDNLVVSFCTQGCTKTTAGGSCIGTWSEATTKVCYPWPGNYGSMSFQAFEILQPQNSTAWHMIFFNSTSCHDSILGILNWEGYCSPLTWTINTTTVFGWAIRGPNGTDSSSSSPNGGSNVGSISVTSRSPTHIFLSVPGARGSHCRSHRRIRGGHCRGCRLSRVETSSRPHCIHRCLMNSLINPPNQSKSQSYVSKSRNRSHWEVPVTFSSILLLSLSKWSRPSLFHLSVAL